MLTLTGYRSNARDTSGPQGIRIISLELVTVATAMADEHLRRPQVVKDLINVEAAAGRELPSRSANTNTGDRTVACDAITQLQLWITTTTLQVAERRTREQRMSASFRVVSWYLLNWH